jgi:hypothetical protein
MHSPAATLAPRMYYYRKTGTDTTACITASCRRHLAAGNSAIPDLLSTLQHRTADMPENKPKLPAKSGGKKSANTKQLPIMKAQHLELEDGTKVRRPQPQLVSHRSCTVKHLYALLIVHTALCTGWTLETS